MLGRAILIARSLFRNPGRKRLLASGRVTQRDFRAEAEQIESISTRVAQINRRQQELHARAASISDGPDGETDEALRRLRPLIAELNDLQREAVRLANFDIENLSNDDHPLVQRNREMATRYRDASAKAAAQSACRLKEIDAKLADTAPACPPGTSPYRDSTPSAPRRKESP